MFLPYSNDIIPASLLILSAFPVKISFPNTPSNSKSDKKPVNPVLIFSKTIRLPLRLI